jgi:hypothetical protein
MHSPNPQPIGKFIVVFILGMLIASAAIFLNVKSQYEAREERQESPGDKKAE